MVSGEVIRAVKDLINILNGAEKTAEEIKDEYLGIELPDDLFPTTKLNTGLILAEAIYLASLVEKTRTLQNLQAYVLTLPQGERRVIYEDFLKASPTRFRRLVKYLEELDRLSLELPTKEVKMGENYLKTLGDTYKDAWNGATYQNRVRMNTNNVIDTLKKDVITSFLLGRSYRQAKSSFITFLLKGSELSRRLIRTESTRVHCQAKVKSYKEQGYTKYRYIAVLDKRTSKICRGLNGKEFYLDEAVVGVNLPPMHPWCRSTIIPIKE